MQKAQLPCILGLKTKKWFYHSFKINLGNCKQKVLLDNGCLAGVTWSTQSLSFLYSKPLNKIPANTSKWKQNFEFPKSLIYVPALPNLILSR